MKNLVMKLKGTVLESANMEKYACITLSIPPKSEFGGVRIVNSNAGTDDEKPHVFYDGGLEVWILSGSNKVALNNGDAINYAFRIKNDSDTYKRVWIDNMYNLTELTVPDGIKLLMHDKIRRLKYIPSLVKLIISSQEDVNLSDFANNYKLDYLILNYVEARGDLKFLSSQTSLKTLQAYQMSGDWIGDISFVANMTELTTLKLFQNSQLTGDISALKNMTELTQCELYETQVQGDIAVAFGNCTKMTKLLIRDSNVTGTVEELMQTQISAGRVSGVLDISAANTSITCDGLLLKGHKYIDFSD